MNAIKIHHQGIMLPAPTPVLINRMAKAGYLTATAIEWKPQDREQVGDVWLQIARAMYSELAVHAGAPTTAIEDD